MSMVRYGDPRIDILGITMVCISEGATQSVFIRWDND